MKEYNNAGKRELKLGEWQFLEGGKFTSDEAMEHFYKKAYRDFPKVRHNLLVEFIGILGIGTLLFLLVVI